MYRLPHGRLVLEASRSDDLNAMRQLAHTPGDSSSLRELGAEGRKTGEGEDLPAFGPQLVR